MDDWGGLPAGEPIEGKTYRADGWIYRDLPRMSHEYFDKFVELVGEENIAWITLADYGFTKRGQLLISPTGMANISAYNKASALTLPLTHLEHAWLLDQLQARPTQKRVLGEGMTGDKLLAFREKVANLRETEA